MGMDTGKALSPNQMRDYKIETIPSEVFEVFNLLIAENLSGKTSVVNQADVEKALVERGFNKDEIFQKGWLDVEHFYKKQGWKITYDKPGYNESYKPSWVFSS